MSKILLRFLLMPVFFGGLLFVPAGRWDLPAFWAYLGIFLIAGVVNLVVVYRTDPTLIQERLRPGPGGQDRHLRAIALSFFAVHYVVAGLDTRFHWSGYVPAAVLVAGLAVLAAAFGIACWAMGVNRFFSSVARIQRDRGHHVITTGPYRFVRHPGYAGGLLMILASGFALGSYWSALVVLPVAALILRRLLLEDRLLRADLEGYAEYATRVRYRVLPGVW